MMPETERSPDEQRQAPQRPARSVHRWDQTTKIVVWVFILVLLGLAVVLFRVVFIPLIIGSVMAYVLAPVVRWLSQDGRIPRGLATALVYLIVLLIVIPLPASLVPWVVRQVNFLQAEFADFAVYLDSVSADTIDILGFKVIVSDVVDEVTGAITSLISTAAPASLSFVFNAAEVVLLVVFTLLVGFYLTKDIGRIRQWFAGLVPVEYMEDVRRLSGEIDGIWSAFLRGQVILMVVVTALLSAASALLGLPQPFLLGVLGGLMEFLPSVGHAIWLITASVLALIEGSATLPVSNFVFFLIVVGFHIAYTQFDLNFLIPRIIGRQVHLHPMVVILGIIVGATAGHFIGGIVGSVLGVALAAPTIASLRVIGRYVHARLFDLDPFPMVGPPSAPPAERERAAAELAAQPRPALTDAFGGQTVGRLRRHSTSQPGSGNDPPAATGTTGGKPA